MYAIPFLSVSGEDITKEEGQPATTARADPLAHGGSKQEALKEGISLKHHEDFLLYLATVSGGAALRYLMIPTFIDSLRRLDASDDIHKACVLTNRVVGKKLEALDSKKHTGQLPKVEYTLKKLLALGRRYSPSEQGQTQSADVHDGNDSVEAEAPL